MNRISTAERRARLAVRHHVAALERVASMPEVVRGVVCLHATDPSTVYLSSWARLREATIDLVDRALYEDRDLVRMLAMRRTMFVVTVDEAPILHAAASVGVARNERRRNEQLVELLGVEDVRRWLRDAEAATLAALEARGEATPQELASDVPALREKVRVNIGKRYEGEIGLSSRVLLVLAAEGKVVRGRPRGTWISSQYRWTPVTRWLGRPMPELPVDEAQVTLVRLWLERFGPGTQRDIRWWTGWTAAEVRRALASVKPIEVDLDGKTGLVLADDLETTPTREPWVALLPALDPTTMGWQGRDWYLGEHKPALFDTNGNAGPTIWVDGRIVGGWAITPAGGVVMKLLEDVGRDSRAAIELEAARLTGWLRGVSSMPRFPTPLYKELVGREPSTGA
jgi:winged helix DNA-binding protein